MPTENRRSSVALCSKSATVSRFGSKKTVEASSNVTACFARVRIRFDLVPFELERPPIHYSLIPRWPEGGQPQPGSPRAGEQIMPRKGAVNAEPPLLHRSEERRVGKECRSR